MQRELEEQRNLIQAIAHQSSSSDLEQEDQSQSQKYERYEPDCYQASSFLVLKLCHMIALLNNNISVFRSIDGSLYVHKQPPGMEVTWDQLLYRLSLLLHSVNTEQDRTMLEVSDSAEQKTKSLNVWKQESGLVVLRI